MLRRFLLLLIFLSVVLGAQCQSTVNLTGSIAYSNGQPFTGTLQITLSRSSAVNMCSSPSSIVRASPILVSVTNGVVSGTPTFVPTKCLTPSVPYFVQFYDTTNKEVVDANWYMAPNNLGTMDVGGMVLSNFGGPIVVAVPAPILQNPSGNQTITQPNGTSLIVNNLTVTGTANGITASAFTVAPSTCSGANSFATGILANGNALCSAIASGVTSFNGRAGAVVPAANDYSYSMLSGLPTIYYQNVFSQTNVQTVRSGIDFSSNFVLGNEVTPVNANTVDLINVGTAGTYSYPTSMTTDAFGRVSSVTALGTNCGGQLGVSCTLLPGNIMMEWGITGTIGSPTAIFFPVAFPTQCMSVSATTLSSTDRITYVTNITNSSFTAGTNGSGASITWIAIGQ